MPYTVVGGENVMRSTGVVVGLTSGPANGKPWSRFDPEEHTEVQIHNGNVFFAVIV